MNSGIKLPFCVGMSPTLGIRGLVATEKISKDQVVESCPAIIFTKNPKIIEQTIFDHYVFDWDETHEALALGYGSLYNHSKQPNVKFELDMINKLVVFVAISNIEIGEELLINYDSTADEPEQGYLTFDKAMDN